MEWENDPESSNFNDSEETLRRTVQLLEPGTLGNPWSRGHVDANSAQFGPFPTPLNEAKPPPLERWSNTSG